MTEPVEPARPGLAVALSAASAATAAGALFLPWWRAERGAVLLGGEPVIALPPDAWTGLEVTGPWAGAVAASAALAVALAATVLAKAAAAKAAAPARACAAPDGPNAARGAVDAPDAAVAPSGGQRPTGGRLAAVARRVTAVAGLGAVAVAGRALVGWGPSGAVGVWITLAAGLAAAGGAVALPTRESGVPGGRVARGRPASRAFRPGARRGIVGVTAATMVVAVVAVPDGRGSRSAPDGPFVPVAAVGAFPLRSGATGLAASGDARPVLADGAPGVVSRAGVVVAADGRARVLARLDRDAPAPIGVVDDRVVRWISADSVAVTALRAGSPVDVVIRGVTEAGLVGADGSVWLRSDADPSGTVRRLDVARLQGTQRIAATWLPVVTIQEPEPPVDLSTVLPVRGGALRAPAGSGQLELLTGTAAGIASTPLAGTHCGAAGVARLDRAAADRSGVWFVLVGTDGERLAHLGPGADRTVRTVATVLPGTVTSLTAPGDGSVLVLTRGAQDSTRRPAQGPAPGMTLWRLPDAAAALDAPGAPPVSCPPAP